MKVSSIQHVAGSIKSLHNKKIMINVNGIINSLFGFLLALTFNDIKDTLVENFLLKIIHANIDDDKKTIKVLKADIDLIHFLDMFIRILLILLFVFFVYRTTESFNN
jgi:hypothetical protein